MVGENCSFADKNISLSVGDCVFIVADIRITIEVLRMDPWSLKWMHFNGSMAATIYDKYLSRGGENVFPSSRIDQYMDVIDAVYRVADSEDYIRDMRIRISAEFFDIVMEETYHRSRKLVECKAGKYSSCKRIFGIAL